MLNVNECLMLQDCLEKLQKEVQEQMAKWMEEFCEKKKVEIEELAAELSKVAEQIRNVCDEIMNKLVFPAIKYLNERLQEYFSEMEEVEMSNNERRWRGLPMVRRRAHIRNIRNGRKRRHRRGK